MPCENEPKHNGNADRTDHGTTEKAAASEKTAGGTTPQTQPLPSSMESEEEQDRKRLVREIATAWHFLENVKSEQQEVNQRVKDCRKDLDRKICELVAFDQKFELLDWRNREKTPSNESESRSSSVTIGPKTFDALKQLSQRLKDDEEDSDSVNMAEYRKSLKKTKSKRSKR